MVVSKYFLKAGTSSSGIQVVLTWIQSIHIHIGDDLAKWMMMTSGADLPDTTRGASIIVNLLGSKILVALVVRNKQGAVGKSR